MPDVTETKAADFTQSFDSRDWARAFIDTVHLEPGIPFDEGSMIGWFANALMRGWDEHARKYPDAEGLETLRQAVRELDASAAEDGRPLRGHHRDNVLMLALSLARTEPIIARRANAWNPMETLFAFLGWLTSRRQRVVFSASDDASVAVDLITAFCKRHGLSECRYGWERLIVPESLIVPEPQPVDLDAIKQRLSQVCYAHRWTDVLRLTEEIERLRAQVTDPMTHYTRAEQARHQATVAISKCLTEPPNTEANQVAGRSAEPTARPSSVTNEARTELRAASGNSPLDWTDPLALADEVRRLRALLSRTRLFIGDAMRALRKVE